MLMGIQVIHTVFQVSLTLGTIAELQIWIVLLGSSADSALVVGQLNFLACAVFMSDLNFCFLLISFGLILL